MRRTCRVSGKCPAPRVALHGIQQCGSEGGSGAGHQGRPRNRVFTVLGRRACRSTYSGTHSQDPPRIQPYQGRQFRTGWLAWSRSARPHRRCRWHRQDRPRVHPHHDWVRLYPYWLRQDAEPRFRTDGGALPALSELAARSDIVSLHCPLTSETHYLVDANSLALMKPGAILINTSRGGLVDTGAAIAALKSRRLGGLGIDVYEQETDLFFQDLSSTIIPDDVIQRLVSFPNVIVTGHQAFFTREAMGNLRDDNLQHFGLRRGSAARPRGPCWRLGVAHLGRHSIGIDRGSIGSDVGERSHAAPDVSRGQFRTGRLAILRCNVRRCMESARAVAATLPWCCCSTR